ncbi:MAG: hypothetical protein IT163_12400 [Bryobacterales bacterium]|nr:hypothetical protein [Bryobacterales bacterium]
MKVLILIAAMGLPVLAEEFHRHHVSALFGANHGAHTSGVAGGDYLFRFDEHFGAAFTYEHTGHHLRDGVGVGSFTVHPWKQSWAGAGLGWETRPGEPTQRLFRLSGGYAVPLGHGLTLGPDLAADFIGRHRVYVIGVAFGFGFHKVE